MDSFNGGEISPGPSVQTDEEILDWVRKDGETALHPSCSAKMGPATDPMAVVDPLTMKVHGMENLRVVDASAMPRTTNGNIHAPVLMLAEKAADIIRGKTIRTTIRRLLHPWQTRPQRWCNGTQSILPILMRPAENFDKKFDK